jgi:outer membrane protein assembly factor BamB
LVATIVALAGISGPGCSRAAEAERPSAQATAPTGWPQWRGIGRDGLSSEVPAKLPAKKLLWQQPLESDAQAGVVVANGFVVAACHVGKEDQVRCFAAENGKPLWTHAWKNTVNMSNGNGPRATPLIHAGRVYTISAVGECCCLDLKKGTLLWKVDFRKAFKGRLSSWGYCSSPIIVDGKLIVSPLGRDAGIAALDPLTGKVLWQTKGGGQPHSSFIAGSFGGVSQIVGYDGEELAGWDPASGKRLWGLRPKEDNDYNVGTPVKVEKNLLVATENNAARLYAFDGNGKIVRQPVASNEDLTPDTATPVYHNGFVFGSGPDFLCLDPKTLKTRWKEFQEEAVTSFTMVIAGNRRLLVVNEEGELALLTAQGEKFELLGKMKICDKTQSHPALAGGRFYIRDAKALYCYDLR